jgi:polysulfide reductase-like protein
MLAGAASAVNPVLLVKDLGRPRRFLNMLRVFKVTSPMSVGSWVVASFGTASGAAAGCELLGVLPRVRALAEASSAVLGLGMSTYTGSLLAGTSIPVWHDARRELPFVFASGAAMTAGAAAAIVTPAAEAGPARVLALMGAAGELANVSLMEHRLGPLVAEPYHEGPSGRYGKIAKGLTVAGAAVLAAAGRKRAGAVAGGTLLLAAGALTRWSVFRAGSASARDPKYTVVPQRERLQARS